MKLLLDENIPVSVHAVLSGRGIDAVSVASVSPGITDSEVIRLAEDQGRIIITFDKEFGEFALKSSGTLKGVILLRITPKNPDFILNIIEEIIGSKNFILEGSFVIVSDSKIRVRKMGQA